MSNQEQKKIVVTGASSGIGRDVALLLLDQGNEVYVTARNEENLRKYFGHNEKCTIVPWDLSKTDTIKDYVGNVCMLSGSIDGFVHCAGKGVGHTVQMIKQKQIDDIFSVNTFAAMLLVAEFSKRSRANKGASFVFISSIAAHTGTQGQSVYAASKGALEGFIKGAASELANKCIRLNAIAPGLVMTDMWEKHSQKMERSSIENMLGAYPLGIGKPIDVANMAEFLLDSKAAWITGQTFIIDGGNLIRK